MECLPGVPQDRQASIRPGPHQSLFMSQRKHFFIINIQRRIIMSRICYCPSYVARMSIWMSPNWILITPKWFNFQKMLYLSSQGLTGILRGIEILLGVIVIAVVGHYFTYYQGSYRCQLYSSSGQWRKYYTAAIMPTTSDTT